MAAADENDDDQTTPPLLLRRIEDIMNRLIDRLEEGRDLELFLDGHTTKKRRSLRHLSQARSLTNTILVLAYCHALYPRVATTREVYYYYVTHFKNQRECDTAIADACAVLGGHSDHNNHHRGGHRPWPRHRLGLHASSRGWYAGPMTTTAPPTTVGTTAAAAAPPPPPPDHHPWAPRPITADWLRHFPLPIYYESSSTTPRCMLLVEKEGIFQRLIDDGGIDGCLIVTGKGFPDLATRALVWTVYRQYPNLPIYGLADCDPYGVAVLNCYNTPPVVDDDDDDDDDVDDDDDDEQNDDDEEATTTTTTTIITPATRKKKKRRNRNRKMVAGQLPIQWLGLRPSQHAHLHFPDAVFQELTLRDRRQLDSLLLSSSEKEENDAEVDDDPGARSSNGFSGSSFCDRSPHTGGATVREEELEAMATTKVELEALHWLGMGFCSEFVTRLVEHNLQQQNNNDNAVAAMAGKINNKGGEKNDQNNGTDDVVDNDAGWMLAI
jgi:hypothetical protein